jgi:hypothetical protein
MLSSLASKLTGNNPNKLAETIQRLTAERDAAKIRQDVASQAWGDALALQAEGDGDAPDTVKLEREMDAASKEFRAKEAALTAAKGRHGAAVVQASRDGLSERWAKAEALANARSACAARLAKSMEAFAADYIAFLEVTSDLTAALPGSVDHDAAVLTEPLLETAVRKELQRLGLAWAFSWPWGIVSIPPFTPQFEVKDLIRQWRDSAMARATGR